MNAPAGYTLARENFPFGRCEMWKNHDTGHCLYQHAGQLVNWNVLAEALQQDWHPLTWSDQAWKRDNVDAFLKQWHKAKEALS
jgi:hypothetical protein